LAGARTRARSNFSPEVFGVNPCNSHGYRGFGMSNRHLCGFDHLWSSWSLLNMLPVPGLHISSVQWEKNLSYLGCKRRNGTCHALTNHEVIIIVLLNRYELGMFPNSQSSQPKSQSLPVYSLDRCFVAIYGNFQALRVPRGHVWIGFCGDPKSMTRSFFERDNSCWWCGLTNPTPMTEVHQKNQWRLTQIKVSKSQWKLAQW
jgi:hypothetical protein